jgi:tRNA nucleotidyltransferase/poly(A) polymerase
LKALEIKEASRFFKTLSELGMLTYFFPSLQWTVGFDGGPYHAETVWEHCMIAGDSISSKYPLVKLAAYLHDVGKVICWIPATNSFIGHEFKGAEEVYNEMSWLRFSLYEKEQVFGLIKNHMRKVNNCSDRALRRLLADLNSEGLAWQDLLRLKVADRVGNLAKPNKPFEDLLELGRRIYTFLYKEEHPAFSVRDLAINGHHVMSVCKLNPSKEVGELLNGFFDFVLEEGFDLNEEFIGVTWLAERRNS